MNVARLPLLLLLLTLSLISCGKQDSDAKLQSRLAGNWILEFTPFGSNDNFKSQTIVDSLGNYTVHASMVDKSNIVRPFDIEGSYRVKDGWLIDTVTNHSQITNKVLLPYINTNRIVRLTEKQLILNYETSYKTGEVVFKKEGK